MYACEGVGVFLGEMSLCPTDSAYLIMYLLLHKYNKYVHSTWHCGKQITTVVLQ